MAVKPNARHEGPAGWYGISSVGSSGRLRTFVRCPRRVRWCGDLESIDWSPNGTSLAFGVTSFGARNPYNGLHIVNFRAGHDRQLVRQGQFGEYDWFDIDWSPDGSKLAYATNGHIAVIDAEGANRSVLQTGTVGHDHGPSWSPDGRWIAFASKHNGHSSIYVIGADGSDRRMVARYGATPAWSPDGRRIAFRGLDRIQYVSPNGRLLAPGIPFRPGVPVGINGPPVWSPDGKKIAMSNRRNGTWIMNVDGSGLRRVSPYAGVALAISQRPRPAWRPR
jgi:Tol biopolymer transport system component